MLNREHHELPHYGRQLIDDHRTLVNTHMFGLFFADFVTELNTNDLTLTPSVRQIQ